MCKIEKFKHTEQDIEKCSVDDKFSDKKPYNYIVYRYGEEHIDEKLSSEESDVLLFGDSFIAGIRGLEISLGNTENSGELYVHCADADGIIKGGENPLIYFEELKYKKGRGKLVVVETIERSALKRALDYGNVRPLIRFTVVKKAIDHIFINDHIEYFFTDNILSYHFFKFINNIKFDYFGDVDNRIGLFSVNPKMLFYYQGVEFNKREKTQYDIESITDNILFLARRLDEKYNLRLIYVIIPNKYSVYHDYVDEPYEYDGFIPAINDKLVANNIEVVDVFSAYKEYRANDDSKLLYYPSDTHYSQFGKTMFLNEMVQKIIEVYP